MATIKFTTNLKRFYPDLKEEITGLNSLPEILEELNVKYVGIKDYVLDEQGRLRKHVNIFIGDELIRDKELLSDEVKKDSKIYIMQALSGG